MTKQRGVKAVDRSKFREYQRVAQHFYDASKDSVDLEYWTAAAVLIVHAAIAYADDVKSFASNEICIDWKVSLVYLPVGLEALWSPNGLPVQ